MKMNNTLIPPFLTVKIVFLLFCFSRLSFAQQAAYDEILINPFWDFYSDNNLSAVADGRGITGIATKNDLSGILLNPASLDLNSKYQIHAASIYKTDVPWLPSIGSSDLTLKEIYPSVFAGAGYKVNKHIETGFAYHNSTSFMLDLGEIIRTDEFGNEIGRYEAYEKFNTHSFTVPVVVIYDRFYAGVNLTYSIFSGKITGITTVSNPDGMLEGRASFGRFIPQFGVQFQPIRILRFGVSFSPGFRQSIEWKIDDGTQQTSNPQPFPARLGIGAELQLKHFNLSFDYNYANTSKDYRLRDRHDFHLGGEYNINAKWTVRAGIFSLRDFRSNDVRWLDPVGSYNQTYFTASGSIKIKKSVLNLTVMDSHLFSSGMIKKTQVTGSFSYEF